MINKNLKFNFNHKDQADKLYKNMTAMQVKQNFDSRGENIRDYIYGIIDALAAIDGSKNIGFENSTVYTKLTELIKGLKDNTLTANDANEKVDELLLRYNEQIINAGNSNAEIVDARGGNPNLKTRMDKVDSHLAEKATYFNTVNEMKNYHKHKIGSKCITLGYHNINDGGGATYYITDGSVTPDEMYTIQLTDGNIANLVTNTEVNLKILGCIPSNDCSSAIVKTLEKNLAVIVPKGNWLCNPIKIPSGAVIKGENVNYEVITNDNNTYENLSILQCSIDCDTFIDCSNSDHITLEICLSSCKGKGDYLNAKQINNFIKIQRTCYSTFDVMVLCINNNGILMVDSWENTFKRLYFRGILNNNVIDIKTDTPEGGISQCTFYDIQSEGFGACILDFENGLFYHNKIYSILVELSPYEPFIRNTVAPAVKIPLFKIGNGSNNLIDSIQINNYSLHNAELDGVVYEHEVFNVKSAGKAFGLNVKTLMFDSGVEREIQLLTQTGVPGFLTSYLIIDSIISPTQKLIRTAMENMNFFKIGSIYQRTNDGLTRMNSFDSITEWYKPTDSSKAVLVSDTTNFNAMNFENAVVKIPVDKAKVANLKVKTGDKISIMYKGTDIAYEIKLLQRNNSVLDTITGTLPSRSTFSIEELPAITQSGIFIASISFSSASGGAFIGEVIS